MTTRKITSTLCALAIATILGTGNAQAHSGPGHDHSTLPVGWTFDEKVSSKIERNMQKGNRTVGLSAFEQATLSQYGIQVGNRFKTRVGNHMMEITRTSSGLRLEGPTLAHTDGIQWNLPLRSAATVVRSSMSSHPGHDHGHLPIEWVFNLGIQQKIANNLSQTDASGAIGLSRGEQKMLERYGIKIGNTFNALINEMKFTVQRTSMGLQVLKHVQGMPMASASENNVGRY